MQFVLLRSAEPAEGRDSAEGGHRIGEPYDSARSGEEVGPRAGEVDTPDVTIQEGVQDPPASASDLVVGAVGSGPPPGLVAGFDEFKVG